LIGTGSDCNGDSIDEALAVRFGCGGSSVLISISRAARAWLRSVLSPRSRSSARCL